MEGLFYKKIFPHSIEEMQEDSLNLETLYDLLLPMENHNNTPGMFWG